MTDVEGAGRLAAALRASGLADAYAAVDWAASGMGDPSSWPAELSASVALMLETRFPALLYGGPQNTYLYNAAAATAIGRKHPRVLGRPIAEGFPETWSQIEPVITAVRASGEASWIEDAELSLDRSGFVEQTHFSYSYSPVRGADGEVAGVFGIAIETTAQVRSHRRLQLLSDLNELSARAQSLEALRRQALDLLSDYLPPLDVVDIVLPRPAASGASAPADLEGRWIASAAARRAGRTRGALVWQPDAGPVPPDAAPLTALDRIDGDTALICGVDDQIVHDASLRDFLQVVTASLAAAVDRVAALQLERRNAAGDRAMSLQLQSSMLGPPALGPSREGPDIASRYEPAARRQQIGGDWYDAFTVPDGRTMLAVGDVAGHDGRAAASMGQLRSLARGLVLSEHLAEPAASSGRGPLDPRPVERGVERPGPARQAEMLDRSIEHLGIDAVATFVLAEIAPHPDGDPRRRTIRWTNAGHVPPVLLRPDGTVRLLDEPGELLLGVDPATPRTEHVLEVEAGSMLVLYTDGLVERRGELLDVGFARLAEAVAECTGLSPDALCEHLLAALGPFDDDDVAVLAVGLGSRPG